jgi:hypothetical protein
MWFALQADIEALNSKIDSFSGDEFVQKMELQPEDDLGLSMILKI